jgi:hypothetical protein
MSRHLALVPRSNIHLFPRVSLHPILTTASQFGMSIDYMSELAR